MLIYCITEKQFNTNLKFNDPGLTSILPKIMWEDVHFKANEAISQNAEVEENKLSALWVPGASKHYFLLNLHNHHAGYISLHHYWQ